MLEKRKVLQKFLKKRDIQGNSRADRKKVDEKRYLKTKNIDDRKFIDRKKIC